MPSFDDLPTEIYDEIFSHIAVPLGRVDGNMVGRQPHTGDGQVHIFDHIRAVASDDFGHIFNLWPESGDLRCRLVSRAFNHAFTRVFFRHEYAKFRIYKSTASQWLNGIIIDKNSIFAPLVSRMHIELSPDVSLNSKVFFEQGHDHEDCKEDDASPANLGPSFATLKEAVPRLPKLERLVVNLKGEWRHDLPVWEEDGADDDSDDSDVLMEKYGPKYDLKMLEQVRTGVADIFSGPDNKLEHLTYLRLTMPCAYDIATIGNCIPEALALRLRHLYLEYIDGTGPGGDLYYTRWSQDTDDVGDEACPYSNLQKKFPNDDHMEGICSTLNRCRNLESLGVVGTQCFAMDSLVWQPASGGLKHLYLDRATTTCEKLLQLLLSSNDDPSRLEAIHLENVRLLDGTWADVFEQLRLCVSLSYAHIYNLVYAREGESSHLAQWNNRPWENVSIIWSEHADDEKCLFEMLEEVDGRGNGVSESMKSEIKYNRMYQ